MFVIVARFEVRPGEEDAFVALHESAGRVLSLSKGEAPSRELLNDARDPSTFISLARFPSREAAEQRTLEIKKDDWFRRLVSLSRQAPDVGLYRTAWKGK